MQKILTWHDDWALHIETLDEDHRALIHLLTDIARCFARGPDEEGAVLTDRGDDCAGMDLIASLEQLGADTRAHFRREEEFMRTIEYPGIGAHRSEHALLIAEYTEMVRDLKAQGVQSLDPNTLESLMHWVVAHILGADRGFADYYFQICGGGGDER